jgi:ribonuclease D
LTTRKKREMSYKARIEKTEISTMPTIAFDGRIITIDTAAAVDQAVKALSQESAVGIDTETRPSFRKGVQHDVSLIQLSTADTCFLIRLNRTGMPDSLVALLENREIAKIGLSLHDDYQALCKRRRFKAGGFIDLQNEVEKFGIEEKSLQKIFAIMFGQRISKSQQLSNWENDVLTDKQKLYAATDAWACLKIYNELKNN